jgi:putative hydrolase of the HAD superfamily
MSRSTLRGRRVLKNGDATHVLLDFFGTLVHYSSSWTEQGYRLSHDLMRAMGSGIGYSGFLDEWSMEMARFEARSEVDDGEFSMVEVSGAFLSRILDRQPTSGEVSALVDTYVAEWNTGVVYPATTRHVVETLAKRFRLAVITNTLQPDLVPNHLTAMGIADYFDTVITSVEHGWRKPHPSIYAEALGRLNINAANAIFVGDNYNADYVGPKAAGMSAYLIDPDRRFQIMEHERLYSLVDLPDRLIPRG